MQKTYHQYSKLISSLLRTHLFNQGIALTPWEAQAVVDAVNAGVHGSPYTLEEVKHADLYLTVHMGGLTKDQVYLAWVESQGTWGIYSYENFAWDLGDLLYVLGWVHRALHPVVEVQKGVGYA